PPVGTLAAPAWQAEREKLLAEIEQLKGYSAPPTEAANKGAPAFGTRPLHEPRVGPATLPQPDEPKPEHAIGLDAAGKAVPMPKDPRDGRRLWLVTLPGHKSRVVCPVREVPLLLNSLPVWATNQGEAWMVFDAYHRGLSTVQQPRIEGM
ncbi:MAG: hypothetical protein ACRD1G_07410, partial [Acidimicrobiales bacterium]